MLDKSINLIMIMELKFENFKVFSKFQHLIISSSKIGKNELRAVEGCAVFKNL